MITLFGSVAYGKAATRGPRMRWSAAIADARSNGPDSAMHGERESVQMMIYQS